MSQFFRQFYDFGPFALDASERVLVRAGEPVHLTPKEFDTLLALVRGAGRVMSKEELLKEIWPDTFVGEATLAQNVFTLRRALGEAEGGRPFIETVPRRGYRFAVKVTERCEEHVPAANAGRADAHAFAAARTDAAARVGDENPTLIRPQAAADVTHGDAAPADSDRAPAPASDASTTPRQTATDAGVGEPSDGRAQAAA
ncbi:MAG TPA: transcriptional regulator, partial [Pyrinomonadaceae bacterium]